VGYPAAPRIFLKLLKGAIMAKYKSKSIEVDARQYDSKNGKHIAHWINTNGGWASWAEESRGHGLVLPEQLFVSTDQGEAALKLGTWVVYVENVFHFYSDEDFKKRFDQV
jgi:hypothetical protein